MANWKKLASGAAGAAGAGGGLNVEDVFSVSLYRGNGTSKTITNGLDLSTEGGLIWSKYRDGGSHALYDSERGVRWVLNSNTNDGQYDYNGDITGLNTDGYDLGYYSGAVNYNGRNYVDWVWRKSPKFFDIVTYTGNGSNGRTISHSLGCAVGMMFIKRTDGGEPWRVFHRSLATTSGQTLRITNDPVQSSSTYFNNTVPTDSVFTVGTDAGTNWSGQEYVAYLFAHNDGDGGFGEAGDQDIIKCGSYTGNSGGVEINLGFEPQWFMCKKTNGTADWQIFDVMRGMHFNPVYQSKRLSPNLSNAESSQLIIGPSPTGISIPDASDSVNINGGNYLYMAIRRGPMGIPESASDVFNIVAGTYGNPDVNGYVAGFTVDMAFEKDAPAQDGWDIGTRLVDGRVMRADEPNAETTDSNMAFDYPDKFYGTGRDSDNYGWMWKRAPHYFDAVHYVGTSNAANVSHNLGVVPEMMWVKNRNDSADWIVYHKDLGNATYSAEESWLKLNASSAQDFDTEHYWNGTAPTATQFTVSGANNVNGFGDGHVAYLFATLDGISKVGSYTGNGTNQNIDCGFTNGAKFVLVKTTGITSNWQMAGDFENGIVAGSDTLLRLDISNARVNFDFIDPYSAGFNVTGAQMNTSGAHYIFYAIAE